MWNGKAAILNASPASTANRPNVSSCDFFFSSRRRHTRYIGDWSSDVCSSDLRYVSGELELGFGLIYHQTQAFLGNVPVGAEHSPGGIVGSHRMVTLHLAPFHQRSEERRVGKEGRSRWSREC